jgi:GR25 family glycosyltransferase involved in LPS biosynthesis
LNLNIQEVTYIMLLNHNNTFCISLKSSMDRRRRMNERCKRAGIEFSFWDASTPDDLTETFHSALSPVEKACAQSHINIWKYMVNYNIDYALIMEDDAVFDHKWKEKFEKIYPKLKAIGDWDGIFLNAYEPTETTEEWVIANEQYLAAAYILSKEAAAYMLNYFKGWYSRTDWMTTRLQLKNKCLTYFPWLVIQEQNGSLLRSKEENDKDQEKIMKHLGEIDYDISNYDF